MDKPRTIIIGISGCSSSGKTTLARLLRDLFPETFILHQDDFYKPESEIPVKNGILDWDCPEAISIPDLEAALVHIHETGTLPVSSSEPSSHALSRRSTHGCIFLPSPVPLPFLARPPPSSSPSSTSSPPINDRQPPSRRNSLTTSSPLPRNQPTLSSKEDLNSVGPTPLSDAQLAAITARVRAWLQPGQPGAAIFDSHPRDSPTRSPSNTSGHDETNPNPNPNTNLPPEKKSPIRTRICILDGFLLYSPPLLSKTMSLLDIKLFLRVSRARALQRREARDGYVTLEGFWKDPPGYVEQVVWPNYAALHGWMFVGGQVDGGELDAAALAREGIQAMVDRGEDVDFGEVVEWAVGVVMEGLERIVLEQGGEGGSTE